MLVRTGILSVPLVLVALQGVSAKFDICCDPNETAPRENALKLIDDMYNGVVEGRHHWWENGDAIIETSGRAEYADSFPKKLQALKETCGYYQDGSPGGDFAGHTCDHDRTQSDIYLYKGPQHGWKTGCVHIGFNENWCINPT